MPSPILLEKKLQLFDIKNCFNKFSPNFYKYLTNDKFCVNDPSGNRFPFINLIDTLDIGVMLYFLSDLLRSE